MSRTRPPNLREWSRLQNHCPFLTPRTRTFLPPAINSHLRGKPNSHNLTHPRLLHTTPSCSAARPAPSTRRKAFQVKDTGRPGPLGQQPPKAHPEEDLPPRNRVADAQFQAHLQILEKNAFPLLSAMLKDGMIDKNMTPKKFKRIGGALLRNIYSLNTISPDLIRNIARAEDVDLDTIFDIGYVIARENVQAARWVLASCLHAGSLTALLIAASRILQGCHGGDSVYNATTVREPSSDTALSRIAVIAQSKSEPHNSDPRVKLLYAKYLGLRGQYEQGIALVQEVLQLIEPSQVYRKSTITIPHLLEPPWQLLAWLKRELRKSQIKKKRGRGDKNGEANDVLSQEEVDALRLGAVEYQDPISLMHYARYMGEESGIQDYEKYMGQAAAAGDKDACRKLANFYYLISVGKYPQLGTRDAKSTKLQVTAETTTEDIGLTKVENSKGVLSTLVSYFGPRPLHEYRALAMEWYRVALAQGCFGSGLHLSLLHGQDGNHETAGAVFQEVQERADRSRMPDSAQKLMAALREGTNVPMGLPLDV